MKKSLLFLSLLAVVATLSSFVWAWSEGGYQVGDKATDFRLRNVNGKMVSLADNKAAKGYIVVFTCNTCPYAKAYEDRVMALHQKYAPQGYPVVAINPNDPQVAPGDSFAEMQKRAKARQYAFPYLLDETQDIARAYGATRTPHVYVLQRTGADFKVAYIGAIDNNTEDAKAATARYVEQAITDLMAGKAASTSSTKAVGCSIKWKKKA